MRDDLALVQTLDFFPPIVDDPFTFGAIAAANALSDVYAMGAMPILALNIAAWPDSLPLEQLADILAGGASKAAEAGIVVAGGHTVTDDEPKYGMVVTGVAHPQQIWTKAGAQPGDVLFLTKPIGTGAISTALKAGTVAPEHLDQAVASMLRLNKRAAELLHDFPVHACTDITGYGLIGHAMEVAQKSGVRLVIVAEAVPLLDGAVTYAQAGYLPGGMRRNRAYYAEGPGNLVDWDSAIPPVLWDLFFDPVTSGGLLFTLPPTAAEAAERAFAHAGEPLWRIGWVEPGLGIQVVARDRS